MKNKIFYIFIQVITLSEIYGECPLGKSVQKASECLKYTNNGTYCCFISPLDDKSLINTCYPFDFKKYMGNHNINYNKNRYSIDCGLGSKFFESNMEQTLEDRYFCGVENPSTYKDCIKSSTKKNSCCYYEGNDLKRCYNLGIKYLGKVKKDGYIFICSSKFILLKIRNLLLLIFILF